MSAALQACYLPLSHRGAKHKEETCAAKGTSFYAIIKDPPVLVFLLLFVCLFLFFLILLDFKGTKFDQAQLKTVREHGPHTFCFGGSCDSRSQSRPLEMV